MTRAAASRWLSEISARIAAGGGLLDLVDAVYVLGDFVSDAAEVATLDLAVEFTLNPEEHLRFAAAFLDERRDRRDDLARAIRGDAPRTVKVSFEEIPCAQSCASAPVLLWKRGESASEAAERQVAIGMKSVRQPGPAHEPRP